MNVRLRYSTWAGLKRDCQQQIELGGMLVRIAESAELYQPAILEIEAPDGRRFSLPGQIVQVLADTGIAVQFSDQAADGLRQLRDCCAANSMLDTPSPSDPSVDIGGHSENQNVTPNAPSNADDTTAKDLARQVEAMTVTEKRQAALHGPKSMRWLLIRDRNKTIHAFVLRNPAITLDEIEQISKMPAVNPEVLRMIAGNPEWTRSISVCRNLVRNPKTPMHESLELLKNLPLGEIRAIAKSANVRTAIQQAARRKVAG